MNTILPISVLKLNVVYHVGQLNNAETILRSGYEAGALSVSHCPDAWTAIAQLGGEPTWSLTKENGHFLNVHHTPRASRKIIKNMAIASGLLLPIIKWKSIVHDDECDKPYYVLYNTKEEALVDIEYEESKGTVRKFSTFVASPELLAFS